MGEYEKWAKAFEIFAQYDNGGKPGDITAEHDIVYAGPDPATVEAEDQADLLTLGWYADAELKCFHHHV